MSTAGFSKSRFARMHDVMADHGLGHHAPGGGVPVAAGRPGGPVAAGAGRPADLVTILLTQRNWTSPVPPQTLGDFWTSVYQAIDD